MEWNVFYHSVNDRKIKKFNIFEHWRFDKDVRENLKKHTDKDEFAKALRSDLFYYYCSKAEYEILISAWCGGTGTETIKVDVYTQVMNNWEIFLDYVWNHKT